jgi:hypothetical protein
MQGEQEMNIRKTILAVAIAALASGTALGAGGSRNFKARLTGAEEVPPVTDTNTRANATFRFNRDFTRLSFTFQLRNGTDIKEAHLHCAPRGANGPIIASLAGLAGPASATLLPLIPGGFSGSLNVTGTLTDASIVRYPAAGTASGPRGCSAVLGHEIVNLAQLAEAMRNGEIYVNAHSLDHPAGVIRGQATGKGGRTFTSGGGGGGTSTGTGTSGTGASTGGTGTGTTGAGTGTGLSSYP